MAKGNLLSMIYNYTRSAEKRQKKLKEIKEGGKAEQSKVFGSKSIVFSFLCVAFIALGAILLKTAFSGNDLVGLFLIILAIAFGISALVMILNAIIHLIYQFKLNKKPFSWIALIALLLSIVASVIAAVLLL